MSSDEAERDDMKMEDDDREPIAVRSIVTGPEAGSIIGRKGETVKNIRAESSAQVNIEGDSPHERIITVRGKTDSIFKAYTMICKVLEQREKREDKEKQRNRSGSPDPDELSLKVLVPAVQVGALIGKGGEKIKEIRAETGADINISSDPLPGSTEREMKVKGKREQITKCIFHICSILLEHPPKGDVRLYKPDSRDTQRDRDRSFRGADRERDYGDRYYRDSYQERNDYERGGRGGGGRQDLASERFGASPFDAILDFARRHDGGSRTRDRETKHEMFVSNEQVGSIIGRKGSKINEIRNMSGANINITEVGASGSKRDKREFADQDRERVIEIFGSPEQVAIAKSLINVAIELAEGSERRDDRRREPRERSRSRDRSSRYDDRRRW